MSGISMWFTATDLATAAQRVGIGLDPGDESVLDPAPSTIGIDTLADLLDIDAAREVVEIEEAVIGTVPPQLVDTLANADPTTITEIAQDWDGDELAGVFDDTDAVDMLIACAEFCRAHRSTPVFWMLLP